ncbi:MAG: 4Fe-4S dicluster domain-containing protein [Candidatus Thiodiazotropha sp. (ex Troendleina suluensis)]|nr:4Fe-4S dicluster domain-containing protein [Candidatus Thiodiazotropha sp. (ex Troendleina suluensis)]
MTKSRSGEAVNPQVTDVERRPGFLARDRLQELFDLILQSGYSILGPVVRDDAIQFSEITAVERLPHGVGNQQQPGRYRLQTGAGSSVFAWNHGPQGLKPLCFSPKEHLWSEQHQGLGFQLELPQQKPTAVIGVRACDLAALAIQDRHFLEGEAADPHYQKRREQLLLIGVNCSHSAETCFCVSTGDGPALDKGYDIGLSELNEGFLIWSGSTKGKQIVHKLSLQPAEDRQLEQMLQMTTQAAEAQQRQLPGADLLMGLYQRLEHGHWWEVAERCLSCGNCTAVCPTCFCYDTQHALALDGKSAQKVRQWSSCFSAGHSSMAGFQVRTNSMQRYRQWLTHKLAGWQEQQGRIGCTGCGRCIAWCPVGIDLTEEAETILWEGSLDV